jgi:hypothetical protein
MLQKKDRKIPHSVFKPHADTVVLLHSTQYSTNDLPKVIFGYPKYCLRNDSAPSFLSVENKILNIESGINGPKFLHIIGYEGELNDAWVQDDRDHAHL